MNSLRLSSFLRFVRNGIPTAVLVLCCLGCGPQDSATGVMTAAAADPPNLAADGGEPKPETPPPPASEPEVVLPDVYPCRGDFAVSHILISHRTAEAAGKQLRTRQQAKLLAQELSVQLQDDPSRFEELARRHSDGPRGSQGGKLGGVYYGDLHPMLEAALTNLAVGTVHSEPIETPFGYHFLRRDTPDARHWAALHVFIPKDPNEPGKGLQLIEEINEQLLVDPLEQVATNYPHDLSGPRYTGSFTGDSIRLPATLTEAVRKLEVGEVGTPIELERGWVYLKRIALAVRAGEQIVISHQDARFPLNESARSREEAVTLGEELLAQLKAAPDNPNLFHELANTHSDAETRGQGGAFGPMLNADLYYQVDRALSQLNEGQMHPALIDTPVGYQIIRRSPPKQEPLP